MSIGSGFESGLVRTASGVSGAIDAIPESQVALWSGAGLGHVCGWASPFFELRHA